MARRGLSLACSPPLFAAVQAGEALAVAAGRAWPLLTSWRSPRPAMLPWPRALGGGVARHGLLVHLGASGFGHGCRVA
eukprot:2389678-Alexandrium_andersonii.AAC.1